MCELVGVLVAETIHPACMGEGGGRGEEPETSPPRKKKMPESGESNSTPFGCTRWNGLETCWCEEQGGQEAEEGDVAEDQSADNCKRKLKLA